MTKPIISGPYRTFRRLNDYESYLEYEGSTITIPMRGRRYDDKTKTFTDWYAEDIKLHAFMRLEIYPPYVNMLGTREFQFTIRDWDLFGTNAMLNQLFYGDPRGYYDSGLKDYVPATVTFRVSNNYEVGAFADGEAIDVSSLFGPLKQKATSPGGLEIRNLTSHAYRHWELVAATNAWKYTHPDPIIFWEILDYKDVSGIPAIANAVLHGEPVLVFHNKGADFKISDASDLANHFLGVAKFHAGSPVGISTVNPIAGQRANQSQINGNTVLSTFSRPQIPLDIRWSLASKMNATADLTKFISSNGIKRLAGYIRQVSPARSLGTADQAPDLGHPVDSADFPARITYAINYDIFINNERFVEDQAGIAIAVGAVEIPPRDVTVAFDKPHFGSVLHHFLEFGPGHCTGMHEITPAEYQAGLNIARYWRTVPLDRVADQSWPSYDPDSEY